ncbi:capsid portal protein [Escherichia coli]|nr:capsid portal protein [Escherichia coli]
MGKSKKNRAAAMNQIQHKSQTSAEAFSFGDPVPVLDRRELLDYVECVQMDRWYEPPVSFDGLARTFRAAVHHSSDCSKVQHSDQHLYPSPAAQPAGFFTFCAGLSGIW